MRKTAKSLLSGSLVAAAIAAGVGAGTAAADPIRTADLSQGTKVVVVEGPGGLHYQTPSQGDLLKAYTIKKGAKAQGFDSALLEGKATDISNARGVVALTRVKQEDLTDKQRDSELTGMLNTISEEVSLQTGAHRGDPLADAAFATRSLVNIQGGLIAFARANGGPEPINHVAYTPIELRTSVARWVRDLPETKAKEAHSKVEFIYLALVDHGEGVDSNRQAKVNFDRASKDLGTRTAQAISDAVGAGFTRPEGKRPVVVTPITYDKNKVEWIGDAVYVDSNILVPHK